MLKCTNIPMSDSKACLDALPNGKDYRYQLILADPPWNYGAKSKSYAGQSNYESLTYRQLKAIPVWDIAAKNCVLLLWTTGVFLPEAIKLMDAWTFKYTTVFAVWRKVYSDGEPVCGIGHYTRASHEFLLLGTRGRVKQYRRRTDLNQLVDDEHTVVDTRSGHSVKPQSSFELIREFFAIENKIELFARRRRDEWHAWGLELEPYFQTGLPETKHSV